MWCITCTSLFVNLLSRDVYHLWCVATAVIVSCIFFINLMWWAKDCKVHDLLLRACGMVHEWLGAGPSCCCVVSSFPYRFMLWWCRYNKYPEDLERLDALKSHLSPDPIYITESCHIVAVTSIVLMLPLPPLPLAVALLAIVIVIGGLIWRDIGWRLRNGNGAIFCHRSGGHFSIVSRRLR